MSIGNALQAISVLTDLITAASHMSGEAARIAAMLQAGNGELSDQDWITLRNEDLELSASLAAAISRRAAREAAGQADQPTLTGLPVTPPGVG